MSAPQAFDGYQVLRLLGQGGMGRVYEVTHPTGAVLAWDNPPRSRWT